MGGLHLFQALNDTVSADVSNATVIEAVCIENVLTSVKVNQVSGLFRRACHKSFSWINTGKSESKLQIK